MSNRGVIVSILIAVTVLVAPMAASAQASEDMTGKVSIDTISVAAGLGYSWGHGVLEYRGQQYPFRVKAFTVADVGVLRRAIKGEVYDLQNAADFEGTFMGALAGAALGAGADAAAMHNQNDVNMVWTGTNQGLGFSLAHAGITVTFTEEARALAARTRSTQSQPAAFPRSTR